MKLALVGLCVGVAMLTGCAATVIKTEDAKEVSGRALLFSEPPGATEPVIVKRGKALAGGACTHHLFADGKPVADLQTGQKVSFRLPTGRHIISVKVGCLSGEVRELSLELTGGQTRTISVNMSGNNEPILQETAF